jgi:hypothetical protein
MQKKGGRQAVKKRMNRLTIAWLPAVCAALWISGCGRPVEMPPEPVLPPAVEPVPAEEPAPEVAPAVPVAGAEQMPLTLELPPALLIGTQTPLDPLPNLEPAREGARPPLMVPAGAQNLALGRTVTSSDEWPLIGDLDFITDGEKQGDQEFIVELGPGLQWVQIDLEQPAGIHAVALWHFHTEARVYHNVIVQLSDGPDFTDGVTTVFNNDHDNSTGFGAGTDYAYVETNAGQVIPVDGVTARYVRLYSEGNTSNDMNHYIEVEVYGLPAE